ncbi:MAG TPA: SDR family NAD(P)-dependent oxidoreductase [Acidisoma sp.]|uniref:SDR family NAD(P)-dependent oxidoreductase n=1 Tax=Acidisoma sp. TaxID=1872115 RepID=UPI002CE57E08|nr:SDR family NAD(P)-dependent oxidoreductase [Acidisoma sp.]HTH99792.1 SDR family NAD(P)-dependent oxidoreductase [Acidisoma sp.]
MTAPPPRIAMISGASRGIGAAIADRLAGAGWGLSLGMRRPVAQGTAFVQAYDIADAGAEEAWVSATLARFGRIDAIICNAGLLIQKSVIDISDAEMSEMLAVNLHAPRRLARAAWPHLKASGAGRVVILSSLSGLRVASEISGAYAVSKHAATALAQALRHAGWDHGIRATAICPGFVATDMAMAATNLDPKRMTQPAEIARLVEMALDLPNSASVTEIAVNWQPEGKF